MTQFIRDKAGNTEAQQKKAAAYLFAQDSTGLATDGVLIGLGAAQTTTASASVNVTAGACVIQDSVGSGVSLCVSDTQETLDVLGANPMGGTPRNDIVVFDSATVSGGTGGVRLIVGTPNAVPTDPTVPTTAVPLARIRNAASATTVPSSAIDNLRVTTTLAGGPFVKASTSKAGKRIHWGIVTVTPNGTGYATVTHGAGFTPSAVQVTAEQAYFAGADPANFTSTTFIVRLLNTSGVTPGVATQVSYACFE